MNQNRGGGVLSMNGHMDALADSLHGGTRFGTSLEASAVTQDESLEREFEERLADSGTLAFRIAYSVLRNRADAEDVAQEALVRAYQRFHALRARDKFRSWLVRICWRLALNHRRGSKRREARETAVVVTAPPETVEEMAAHSEFQRRLFAAMDALPEKLRIALVLSGIQGYDTREVAALLGVPEGTVKSRIHAARQRLSDRLSELMR